MNVKVPQYADAICLCHEILQMKFLSPEKPESP